MRYKVVPPVRSIEFLREAAGTLPLVPGSVEDCCSRVRDGTEVVSRDEAREYLTFMQALGLISETDRGFHRVRKTPDDDTLAAAFRECVFGTAEVLAAVADEPQTAEAVFAVLGEEIPQWERDRYEDWETQWRERTERLLGWAITFGLVRVERERDRETDRFVATSGTER